MIRYIHNNPVKAGIVAQPQLYPWSSDQFFRSGAGPSWLDLDHALAFFDRDRKAALRRYRTLMLEDSHEYEAVAVFESSVKGDEEFASRALRDVTLPRRPSRDWTAEALARSIASSHNLTVADLASADRRRQLSGLRIVAAYLGRERLGIPISQMARLFRREETGLAHGVRSLVERMTRQPELKAQVERIAQNAKLPA